eukprot:1207778-Lingulodinium_polyedra.AAC.1
MCQRQMLYTRPRCTPRHFNVARCTNFRAPRCAMSASRAAPCPRLCAAPTLFAAPFPHIAMHH